MQPGETVGSALVLHLRARGCLGALMLCLPCSQYGAGIYVHANSSLRVSNSSVSHNIAGMVSTTRACTQRRGRLALWGMNTLLPVVQSGGGVSIAPRGTAVITDASTFAGNRAKVRLVTWWSLPRSMRGLCGTDQHSIVPRQ